MKKILNKVIIGIFVFLLLFTIGPKEAYANAYRNNSTRIDLNKYDSSEAFEFEMPIDGKIKLNIKVKDQDNIPGSLRFTIQTGYGKDSTIIKEIAGITSSNGVIDQEIELSAGEYYFHYELRNDTGDLTDTALALSCKAEILPTIAVNIAELRTHNITSFKEITQKDYDIIKFGEQDKELILPFTADNAGGLLISLGGGNAGVYQELEARIYKDKGCTQPVGEEFSTVGGYEEKELIRTIPNKGTYYIKFSLIREEDEDMFGLSAFSVKLYVINGEARELAMNKTVVAYESSDNKKITYKINVKNTGIIGFGVTPYDNSNGGSANFQLLDKNKKKITPNSYVRSIRDDDYEFLPISKYYTVVKGTYYLQINSGQRVYQLASYFSKTISKAGNKKSNAKLLKVGNKPIDGYATLQDKSSKVDWYKFAVPSSKYVNCTIGYKLDGDIRVQVLDSKGQIIYDNTDYSDWSQGFYYHWFGMTYPKGTYYVKVYKGSKTSSLQYAIAIDNNRR